MSLLLLLQTAFLNSPSSSCRTQDILAAEVLIQTHDVNMHTYTKSTAASILVTWCAKRGCTKPDCSKIR